MSSVGHEKVSTGRGAFAMLDALGFKGIWRKYGHHEVLAKLGALRDSVDAKVREQLGGEDRRDLPEKFFIHAVRLAFLSDTIVIGVPVRNQRPNHQPSVEAADGAATIVAATFASHILRLALRDPQPRLAFRGCIAVGEFAVDGDERFIVGPAVDDAAQLHEQAEGAIVWLAPSAQRVMTPNLLASAAPRPLFEYSVPLKGGSAYDTFAVSPFAHAVSGELREDVENAILETFERDDGRLDVAIKQQNTARFLGAAWDAEP